MFKYSPDELSEPSQTYRPSLPHHRQTHHQIKHAATHSLHSHCSLHLPRLLANPSLRCRPKPRSRFAVLGQTHHGLQQRHSHGTRNFSHHLCRLDHPNFVSNRSLQNHLKGRLKGRRGPRRCPCHDILLRRGSSRHSVWNLWNSFPNVPDHHGSHSRSAHGCRNDRHFAG